MGGRGSYKTPNWPAQLLPRKTQMTDASQSDKSEQDQEPMKVLLVDDYPENRSVLEFVLRRLNVTCIQAEDGDQAIAQCSEQAFGLIFLDYHMPGKNGFDTAKLK